MSNERAESIDLADLDGYVGDGKWSLFRELRRDDPVHLNEGSALFPFWAITRYEDVVAVARNRRVFSSDMRSASFPTPMELIDFGKYGRNHLMLLMDDPGHGRLRRLVTKGFTPRAVAAWEPHVGQSCDALLDRVPSTGEWDVLPTLAAQLPMYVICALLGVPLEDCDLLFAYTNQIVAPTDPEFQTDLPEGAEIGSLEAILATHGAGWLGVLEYFEHTIADRRKSGIVRDDLITVLDDAEIEGDKLTDQEILWFCALLFGAGSETTRNAISGGLLAFGQHPDQLALLKADPALAPSAVEEILRYVTPANYLSRWATSDIEMHGKTIRKGDMVNLYWSSADRDEMVFDNPEAFDITRTPNEHLSFGHGAHFCLGSGLARIEIRMLLERFLARFSDVEVVDHEWTHTDQPNALKSLRIVAAPATGTPLLQGERDAHV